MISPRVRTPGIVFVAIAAVAAATLMPVGVAHADVAFRKKKPAGDSTPAEVEPSGGEATAAAGGDAPASDDEAPPPAKTEYVPQAEDKDRPHEPSLLDPNSPEAQLKAKAAKKKAEQPIYQKWQFWAIAGGAAIVVVGAIIGGFVIAHQINGGDIRPCGDAFAGACFGQGR